MLSEDESLPEDIGNARPGPSDKRRALRVSWALWKSSNCSKAAVTRGSSGMEGLLGRMNICFLPFFWLGHYERIRRKQGQTEKMKHIHRRNIFQNFGGWLLALRTSGE